MIQSDKPIMRRQRSLVFVSILLLLSFYSAKAQRNISALNLDPATIQFGREELFYSAKIRYELPGQYFSVENGAKAEMKAANRIELGTGFRVEAGGNFQASIDKEYKSSSTNSESGFAVFPNSVKNKVTIQAPENIQRIRVIDINGVAQLEYKDVGQSVLDLDLSGMQTGFYVVEIITNSKVERRRIVKE
jgi:Secretion system C-terminal sorting domain